MDFDTPILFSVFRKKSRHYLSRDINIYLYKCAFNETNVNIIVFYEFMVSFCEDFLIGGSNIHVKKGFDLLFSVFSKKFAPFSVT